MFLALADADCGIADIRYINAHATSTAGGDRAEARAIDRLLAPIEMDERPPVSSTKALTGHGLSMAGAMETAFCMLSTRQGFVPGCAHLQHPDPNCAPLNLPQESVAFEAGPILKNSSGFGGSNVCLVMEPA
jgi:3-oxoacyl-(acyl-carrier-protein) synthase